MSQQITLTKDNRSLVIQTTRTIVGNGGSGVSALSVVDIDDPSAELNAISGSLKGDLRLVYQLSAGTDEWTLYAWDDADSVAENVPYRIDGLTGMWSAIAGKYHYNGIHTPEDITVFGGLAKEINLGETVLENTSTGVFDFDGLSLGTPSTDLDFTSGEGHILDIHDDPKNPTFMDVAWDAGSITISNLNSGVITWIYIDSAGAIQQQTTQPTGQQRRENLFLGFVVTDGAAIFAIITNPFVAAAPGNQLDFLFIAIGTMNLSVSISAGGANLTLANSAGSLVSRGRNFDGTADGRADPNKVSVLAVNPINFNYVTQDPGLQPMSLIAALSNVIPGSYDVAGTVTAIPGSGNRATNQRLWMFPNGNVIIQYGQQFYNTLSAAVTAAGTEAHINNPNFALGEAILLATLSITKGCTDLTDTGDAKFLPGGKFGDAATGGAGASVIDLQQAYTSGDGTILTDTVRNAVKLQRGTALDTDDVLEILNGAGSQTFGVDGDGVVTPSAIGLGGHVINDILISSDVGPSTSDSALVTPGWIDANITGGVTLDGAYDFGGAGSGAAIIADSGAVTITTDGVGVAETTAFELINTTVAALNTQQFSPMFVVGQGSGWETDVGSPQVVKWAQQVETIQGGANPAGELVFKSSIENVSAGAYADVAKFSWDGALAGMEVGPDTDASFVFGRTRIDARGSDAAYFSHYDMSGTSQYALQHNLAGDTRLNSQSTLHFQINAVSIFQMGVSGFVSSTIGSFRLNSGVASATVPTLIPHNSASTAGMGANSPGEISLITGATEALRITASQRLLGVAGTELLPTWSFIDEPNAGMWWTGSRLALSTTGATDIYISMGANQVTIGVNEFVPEAALDTQIGSNARRFQKVWSGNLDLAPKVNTSGVEVDFILTSPAHTNLTASTEVPGVLFDFSADMQHATGAIAIHDAFKVLGPTYSFVGASVIAEAATMAIIGAPAEGANATIDEATVLRLQRDAIGTAEDGGALLVNTTDAAAGAQQHSPMFVQVGEGWRTDAIAETQSVAFAQQVIPIQGAANPTGDLVWKSNINGAGYADLLTLSSGGDLTLIVGHILLGATRRLVLDNDEDTYIYANADDQIRIVVGGVLQAQILGSSFRINKDGTEAAPAFVPAGGGGANGFFLDGTSLALSIASTEAVRWDASQVQINAAGINPDTDSAFDLGLTGTRWRELFIDDVTITADVNIGGDLNHDGTLAGLYGVAPVAQSDAYTLNATAVLDRTLLASASATVANNNNVIAAIITDLQALGAFG